MWELRKREQSGLTPRFLPWAKAGGGAIHSLSKGTSKLLSTQQQAHSKYLVKVNYNYYHKFSFRCVVLDKY